MFEIGKQYKGVTSGRIVEVLFVGTQRVLVRNVNAVNDPVGTESTLSTGDTNFWREHTPPVVHTEEYFVKWGVFSGFRVDDEPSCFHETPGSWLVGKVRFTYTEGEPLKAEVL